MPDPTSTHVAVVGGGISGLATAHYVCQLAQTSGTQALRCMVLESDSRLGGKILTERTGGFVIEGGPESFVTRKPWALALCRELGLADRLLGADDAGRNYVLHRSQLVCVPAQPRGFLDTPLLSLKGKLRAAGELFIPPRKLHGDESLGHFVRRRFGDEVLDKLVAPAVGSIYLSDVNQLSAQVSFERFQKLEQAHGSLLKGMLAAQRAMRSQQRSGDGSLPATKPAPFITLPNGLVELVDALQDRLRACGCEVRTGARVNRIERIERVDDSRYQITINDGETLVADAVVLATPTFAMAELIAPHDTRSAAQLRDVRYMNVATVSLAYRRTDAREHFDGFGVIVPEREPATLLACEAASNKWPGRAPDDCILLRAFVGGHRREALVAQADDALIELTHQALADMFGIHAQPLLARVYRWQPGNPQYPVGHLDALAQVETRLKAILPRVFLTGAGMRGLGIPDCVRQAKETAARVFDAVFDAMRERP